MTSLGTVARFIDLDLTASWTEARALVERSPELLSQQAFSEIRNFIALPENAASRERLNHLLSYLERCHSCGLAHATAEQLADVRCSTPLTALPHFEIIKRYPQIEQAIRAAKSARRTSHLAEAEVRLISGHVYDLIAKDKLDQALLFAALNEMFASHLSPRERTILIVLKGRVLRLQADIVGAEQCLQRAVRLVKRVKDVSLQVNILLELGGCAQAQNKLLRHCHLLEKLARLSAASKELEDDAWIYFARAADARDRYGQSGQAITLCESALALTKEHQHLEGQLYCHGELADLFGRIKQPSKQMYHLRSAVRIAGNLDNMNVYSWRAYQLAKSLWPDDKVEALTWYREAIARVPLDSDWSGAALYMRSLGLRLRDEHQLREAEALYQKAVELSIQASDPEHEIYFRGSWAKVLKEQGRLDDTIAQFDVAIEVCRVHNDILHEASFLDDLADIYFIYKGQVKRATELRMQALGITRQSGEISRLIRLLLSLADMHQSDGEWDAAERYGNEAFQLAHQHSAPGEEINALIQLGQLANSRGLPEKQIILLEQALAIAKREGNVSRELGVWKELCRALHNGAMHAEAHIAAAKALELADHTNEHVLFIGFLTMLTELDGIEEMWPQIEAKVDTILKTVRQRNDSTELEEILYHLGILYYSHDSLKAELYTLERIEHLKKEEKLQSLILAMADLATIYSHADKDDLAIPILEQALALLPLDQRQDIRTTLLITLAHLFRSNKQFDQSEQCFQEISELAGMDGTNVDQELRMMIYEWSGDTYFEQEKWDDALGAYLMAASLREQLLDAAVDREMRFSWLNQGYSFYQRFIWSAMRVPQSAITISTVLEYVEASRSRMLAAELGIAHQVQRFPGSAALKEKEHLLLSQMRGLQEARNRMRQRYLEMPNSFVIASQFSQQQSILQQLQSVWQEIAATSSEGEEYISLRRGWRLRWTEIKRLLDAPTPG